MSFPSRKSFIPLAQKLILDVRKPTNTPVSLPIFYGTVDNSAELAIYAANYNAVTGIYTVPAGGHENIRIRASQTFTSLLTSNLLQLQIDGVKRVQQNGSTQVKNANIEFFVNNLNAGQTIKIVANGGNESGGASGEFSDYFQIFADR